MLFGILVVLIAILALLLVGVVLLQSGKGGGLAGVASTGTTQILGARQAPDVLEKATWVIGGLFIVLCILTSFTLDTSSTERSVLQDAPLPRQRPPRARRPPAPSRRARQRLPTPPRPPPPTRPRRRTAARPPRPPRRRHRAKLACPLLIRHA